MYITGIIINKDIKIKPFCIILVPQLLKYLVFLTKKWYKYILVIPDIILNCLILFIKNLVCGIHYKKILSKPQRRKYV